MKRLVVACGYLLVVSALVGCQHASKPAGTPGKVKLPPDIAGTWKAKDSVWKIVLTPEGTVASAVIAMGGVEVKPHQETPAKGWGGQPGLFKTGACNVEYIPQTRQLTVNIDIERLYVNMDTHVLEGKVEDLFTGPVSQNGKTWQTTNITSLDCVVLEQDPNAPGDQPQYKVLGPLTTNPDHPGQPLTFKKVPDEKKNK